MAIIQCANWRDLGNSLGSKLVNFSYGQDGRPVRDASGQPVVNGGAIEDIVNDADTAEGLPSPIKTLLTGSDLSVFQGTVTELSDTRMSGGLTSSDTDGDGITTLNQYSATLVGNGFQGKTPRVTSISFTGVQTKTAGALLAQENFWERGP